MTIDENQTPTENLEETPKEPETATEASQTNEAAPAADAPTTETAAEAAVPDPASEAPAAEAEAPVAAEAEAPPVPEAPVAAEADAPSEPEAPAPAEEPVAAVPEPPAPVQEAPPVAVVKAAEPKAPGSDMDLFEAAMEAMEAGEDTDSSDGLYKKLQRGDRIEATVIQVDVDKVFVDLGTKSEGLIPLSELSELNLESAKDHVKVGDKINVVVLRPEGGEGNPIVSKKRADFEASWDQIEETFKAGHFINAQVVDRVKGGLVVDVGVRGFVPATHVGSGRLRNIEKYVGQPLKLKIIEIDRDRKKVVLSNREAEEERRASAREEIFEQAAPGDVREGVVRRLADYGAFVDLGGVDGLLHISEMSWMRINHPREMFKEGQKISVMILRLDKEAGKISLGHRQVLPDPWNLIRETYTVGQKLTCTIGRIVQSGAFIRLPEGAEAFMPVSEMSARRIRKPQEVIEENQEVEAQIIDLRTEERRMVLSIRALGGTDFGRPATPGAPGGEFEDDAMKDKRGRKTGGKRGRGGRRGREDEEFEEVIGRRGFATGGATIGERLGMLKGFVGRDEEEDIEAEAVEEVAELAAGVPVVTEGPVGDAPAKTAVAEALEAAEAEAAAAPGSAENEE